MAFLFIKYMGLNCFGFLFQLIVLVLIEIFENNILFIVFYLNFEKIIKFYIIFPKHLLQPQPQFPLLLPLLSLLRPSKSKSRMLVFVARFVSFAELSTESKNTHKISCDIFPSFSTKYFKISAKGILSSFETF